MNVSRQARRTLTGYAFLGPWLFALVFVIGYPFVASLYFSACEYPPLRGPLFVGLDNYKELALDHVFHQSMGVTLIFAAIAIPLGVVLALTLALFLNARIKGRSVYRVIYYLPHLIPSVVVAILWMWMFNPQFGILNVVLRPFGWLASKALYPFAHVDPGMPGLVALLLVIASVVAWRVAPRRVGSAGADERRVFLTKVVTIVVFVVMLALALASWLEPTDLDKIASPGWLTDANPFPSGLSIAPSWALWALIYMNMWGVGQMAVIYLAKLQDVPVELYEAAELDGANWWQKTFYVTIPMISPVILFNIVMGIIGAFQVFAEPYIMTAGGPEDKTRFIAMFIYDQAFQYQRLGYAAAVAWVLFLVIVGLTMLALRISRERVYYASE